jgi:tetratricopeptide (TPR) repeat protein
MNKALLTVFLHFFVTAALYSQNKGDSTYYNKAFDYYGKGNYVEAINDFSLSIKSGYKPMKSYMYRGATKMVLKRYREARADLLIAFRMDASNDYVNFLLGRLDYFEHKNDSAIFFCRRAIMIDSTDADYFDCIGLSYAAENNFYEAVKSADRAISLSHNNPIYINNRGMIKMSMGSYDDALHDFNVELENDPGDETALANIAFCHYKLGDNNQALQICQQVLQKDPDMPYAILVRGQVYYDLKQQANACADFTRLSHLSGEYGEKGKEALRKYCH